jgi:hypothetical protein
LWEQYGTGGSNKAVRFGESMRFVYTASSFLFFVGALFFFGEISARERSGSLSGEFARYLDQNESPVEAREHIEQTSSIVHLLDSLTLTISSGKTNQPFTWRGRKVSILMESGTVIGLVVNGENIFARTAYGVDQVSLILTHANGSLLGAERLGHGDSGPFNEVFKRVSSEVFLGESRPLESFENALHPPGLFFPSLQKNTPRTVDLCQTSCDSERDMESAQCDSIYEGDVAIIGAGLLLADKMPAPQRNAAIVAAGVGLILASISKQGCKASALATWAACRSGC